MFNLATKDNLQEVVDALGELLQAMTENSLTTSCAVVDLLERVKKLEEGKKRGPYGKRKTN